jgi:hypothetical protein
VLILSWVAVAAYGVYVWRHAEMEWPHTSFATQQALLDELKTVRLENCLLRRYGGPNGGGYLMCENLAEGVASAYSYGIDREDDWGCDVSRQLNVAVHQYDCFTAERPTCPGGRFVFHDECVGPRRETIDGRPFDTISSQIQRNGDTAKPLFLKMDVEGAEWESLMATPDSVLDRFIQLPMELHLRLADERRFLELVKRLKEHFYLVNLHFNNNRAACTGDGPLPSRAFQTLWVNKHVGVLDANAPSPAPASPLNAPDDPRFPECRR